MNKWIPTLALALVLTACEEKPYGALPTPHQIAWQDLEMTMFCHFGPNTFTGLEWGEGTEAEDLFNPTDLDCRQWARTAKAAGFKGIIITAKHHDGFCLWPSPVSKHTVRESSWRGGQGDVLKELSEACAEEGVKFGVYISPWDRNDPHYGSPEDNDVFVQTLESVLGGAYGPVFEQWFDGANGEGPDGKKQVYDWPLFNGTVLKLQPQAIIFSDVGPGCRWVGNEEGHAGRTNWGTLNADGFTPGHGAPSRESLNQGDPDGQYWIPAETDVSIRPGWFWRESENDQVKSVNQLLKIYYESVGRNSLLLLNVPPDTRGHLHEVDSTRLMEFRSALDQIFDENLALGQKRKGQVWTVKVNPDKPFNRVVLTEDIAKGQRVASFMVEALTADGWKQLAEESTIGHKRIVLVPDTCASEVRVTVTDALAKPLLGNIGLYYDPIYTED